MRTKKKHKVAVLSDKDYENYVNELSNGQKVEILEEEKKD